MKNSQNPENKSVKTKTSKRSRRNQVVLDERDMEHVEALKRLFKTGKATETVKRTLAIVATFGKRTKDGKEKLCFIDANGKKTEIILDMF